MKSVRALFRGHTVFLANATMLVLGSWSGAVFGFAFWWLSARAFLPAEVGTLSAVISAMTLVGMLGEAGFGTMLVGETKGHLASASTLINAALAAGSVAPFFLAVPVAVALGRINWMTPTIGILFVLGCALTGLAMVFDLAFVGLLQTRYQLYRNLLFSAFRLVLLAAGVGFGEDKTTILFAWVAGLALSLAITWGFAWARGVILLARPDFRALRSRMSMVIDHHLLNLAAMAPLLILPLLVNWISGPAVNAAFYAGWTIFNIASFAPASLTAVLFTVGMIGPSDLPRKLRLSFVISLGFAAAAGCVFALAPRMILATFSPAYPDLAASAVQLFGFGLLGGALKQHYVLFMRLERNMMLGAVWLAVGACLEVALAIVGGRHDGVHGLTAGWNIALAIEMTILLLPRLRTLPRKSARSASMT